MKDKVKIETYKKVDLFYNKSNGKIQFEFEGRERSTQYVFEARDIIDEPVWEDCDLRAFYVEGLSTDFIGTAIAKQKDIKTDKPNWQYKDKYDKSRGYHNLYSPKIYPMNEHNSEVYERFAKQWNFVLKEKRQLEAIVSELIVQSSDKTKLNKDNNGN